MERGKRKRGTGIPFKTGRRETGKAKKDCGWRDY